MDQKPPESIHAVTCTHCHQKQFVRTEGKFNIRFMHTQSIYCVECAAEFDVILPYQIMGGPSLFHTT
jgi:hypothetical protein